MWEHASWYGDDDDGDDHMSLLLIIIMTGGQGGPFIDTPFNKSNVPLASVS